MQLLDKIETLGGNWEKALLAKPRKPYAEESIELLSAMSTDLLAQRGARSLPDVVSFAYWCRRANLRHLKEVFGEEESRLGLGFAFHIAPSNVPVNFAFSAAFSLLAGNSNIVRLPSKPYPQIEAICESFRRVASGDMGKAAERVAFVRYEKSDEITDFFSSRCDARLIWGGDVTIRDIRRSPLPERSIDIAFADRYSLCVMEADTVANAAEDVLRHLADGFYNDVYLMDQNACSSPHLILWTGATERLEEAKRRFWSMVETVVEARYGLEPVFVMDKYTQFCENAIDLEAVQGFAHTSNYVYRVSLRELPAEVDLLRGKCGYFYEYFANDLDLLTKIVSKKYQTLTYFGLDKNKLARIVVDGSLPGIDRIVPIGRALDISIIWDGYDLARTLSRIIEVL